MEYVGIVVMRWRKEYIGMCIGINSIITKATKMLPTMQVVLCCETEIKTTHILPDIDSLGTLNRWMLLSFNFLFGHKNHIIQIM